MFKVRLADPANLASTEEMRKLSSMNAALFEQNTTLTQLVETYREREVQLQAEVEALHVLMGQNDGAAPVNDRAITEIRRRFEVMFHPDKYKGLEKIVRQEIFKEFFGVIQEVQEKYRPSKG